MDLGLKDRNVLITGGSKGIGLACARAFDAEGARIALVSRSRTNLEAARKSLGEAFTAAADLTDAAAAAAMVELVEEKFGPIDVLVNSAGAARRTQAEDLDPAIWRAGMEAKYFSYINVIDPVIKLMARRGRGAIVNIIGNGGKFPSSVHLPGGAANAALMLVTAGLASTYAARGVRVVGVNPGPVNTERVSERLKVEASRAGITESEARERAVKSLPQGRFAEPDEIADIVVFAASERGRYLTGANITVNGAASTSVV
ncbi:MAG: SDR family NAD(P)-dependent oxidoreductase [Desulfobacterales bacterium]